MLNLIQECNPNYVKEMLVSTYGNKTLLTNILNNELTSTGLFFNDIYNLTFIGTNDNYINRR